MRRWIEGLRTLRYQRTELARALIYGFVFRPAAYVLPSGVLWFMAQGFAALLLLLDGFGRTARRQYRRVLATTELGALKAYWRRQANLLYEHAWQHLVIAGRSRLKDYDIRIEAAPEVLEILAGSGSFVLGAGHFVRGPAGLAMSSPDIGRRPYYVVAMELRGPPRDPHEWRMRLQLAATLKSIGCWSPAGWGQVVYQQGALARVIPALKSKAAILFVNVDAHWKKDRGHTVSMPFAGFADRVFATGAARAARLAGCPLLLLMPTRPRGRAVTVKILGPYESEYAGGEEADADRTRQMLRDLEVAVGEYPEGYALEFGGDRGWDPINSRWRLS